MAWENLHLEILSEFASSSERVSREGVFPEVGGFLRTGLRDRVRGPLSEETCRKISKSLRGRSARNKGRPHTQKTRDKMAVARRASYAAERARAGISDEQWKANKKKAATESQRRWRSGRQAADQSGAVDGALERA